MSDKFSREILRRNVAQICQTIGWNGIHSTPLDVLVHILETYIKTLGSQASHYAEEFNRTQPNLHDLGLVFKDLHINLPELNDYIQNVPSVPSVVTVDKYPKPKEPSLNFLKPGSHEVVTRPVHIHEYLPPIYPDKETPTVGDVVEIHQNGIEDPASPEISVTESPDRSKDVFKRPGDPLQTSSTKRPKLNGEESHTREITSVMMTMSGFLSPAREGKLPEARAPLIVSERKHIDKHKTNHSIVPSEKKSKKSKLINGKIMKNKRKDKHKGENKHRLDPRKTPGLHAHHPLENHVAIPKKVPVPFLEPIRNIKTEPIDPMMSANEGQILNDRPSAPLKLLEKKSRPIPVPKLIPKHKSPISTSIPIPQPMIIKQEIVDDEVKLASQPDRSKINIFKRISNKGKDEKLSAELELGQNKSTRDDRNKNDIPINNNTEPFIEEVPKNIDLTTNEVISLDDESIDFKPSIPELEKTPMKAIKPLPPFPTNPLIKPKKDKKHKDSKKDKEAIKAAKMNEKLLKKLAAQSNRLGNFPQKVPKPKKIPKSELKQMPPFPMPPFSNMPRPAEGGMPDDYMNNMPFRPFPLANSHLLANPFAMPVGHVPGPSHGLPNPILMGHLPPPNKQNMQQLLRRPDLEVFPVQGNDEKKHLMSSSTSITVKEKHKPTVPNIIQKNKKHSHPKEFVPKPELVNKVSLVQPDVTIELNPPVIKTEPTAQESPPKPQNESPPEPQKEIKTEPSLNQTESMDEKSDKKKDKLHKKEKKDKEHKKKKEKKDKHKDKLERKKDSEESPEAKEKSKKDKKEKKRDKEKELIVNDGLVPKLTLKLGSASPLPPSSPDIVKLNIKPVIKREDEPSSSAIKEERLSPEPCRSPEMAQISPLVTRPPKQKHQKHNHIDQLEVKTEVGTSPPRKHKDKSKYKRILIKPIAKMNQIVEDETIETVTEEPTPPVNDKLAPVSRNTPYYIDDIGNKVWVCPACGKPDNGTPMIGCDGCDCWYHWVCVGITKEPGASEDWFCKACDSKKAAMVSALAGGVTGVKKRGRKPRDRV